MKIELEIDNCLDCPKHIKGYDPDPFDSFNYDDMYCACTLLPNEKRDNLSLHYSDRQEFKIVTCGDRPYQLKKYSSVPDWCPLRK